MINLKGAGRPLKDMFRRGLCHLRVNEDGRDSAVFVGNIDGVLGL